MKKLLVATTLAVAILVYVLCAEAVTRVTFINRTDRDVYVALYVDSATRGWFQIAPNATWIYESQENVWSMGYYAEGRSEGRETLRWQGGAQFRGWVHPRNPFNIRRQTRAPAGSRQVGFRRIGLMREIDLDERITNFVATVTFNENPRVANPGDPVVPENDPEANEEE